MPTQTPELTNPDLIAIARRVADIAIISIQKAIAHSAKPAEFPVGDLGSLEQAFASYFTELPEERKVRATAAVIQAINAPTSDRTRDFGALAAVDFRAPTAVAAQAAAIQVAPRNPVDFERLRADLGLHPAVQAAGSGALSGFRQQFSGCTLSFSVDNVHCDKVTGTFGFQDDNIALGGVMIDTMGNVAPIVPFDVGSFSNGQDRPGRSPFAAFDIDNLGNWPKSYSVTFVMAEKHSGGIYNFVFKLADQAKSALVGYLTSAATTAAGALIGGVIGAPFAGIGALVGAAVGAAVGWVIGEVWGWMKAHLFGDDIFKPATSNVTLPAPGDLWAGATSSPPTIWDLRGYQGEYHVAVQWNLAWQPNVNTGWHLAFDGDWYTPIHVLGQRGEFHKGKGWIDWTWLGPAVFNYDMAAASWGPDRVDLFGIGLDDALWHRVYNNYTNVWGDWQSLGGGLTSGPAAVAWNRASGVRNRTPGSPRLDVVARGLDGAMWHIATDNSVNWSPWQSLGGKFLSAPAIASWGTGRLDVFGIGLDSAMYHSAWNGHTWSAWESLGGVWTSGPAAVSWGPNRIDVFARGRENTFFHIAWTAAGWSGWEQRGGQFNYRPAVACMGENRLNLFGIGTDFALYQSTWNGSTWSNWEFHGGVSTSAPAAVSSVDGRIDVFARGQ